MRRRDQEMAGNLVHMKLVADPELAASYLKAARFRALGLNLQLAQVSQQCQHIHLNFLAQKLSPFLCYNQRFFPTVHETCNLHRFERGLGCAGG